MNFAGQDYAYISRKKIEKLKQQKTENLNNQNINMLNTVSEVSEISVCDDILMEEEEKAIDNDLSQSPSSNIIQIKDRKRASRVNFKSKTTDKIRKRSRSNSCELINDAELDQVYSDEEDIEKEEQVIHEADLLKKEKATGLFSAIGDKLKGLFSKNEKKEKKVCYSVSQLRNRNPDKKLQYEHEVDTNVFSINFEFLKDKMTYATGDPTTCKCEAVLNNQSTLIKIENSEKYLWICEFCNEYNQIFIENEEIPKSDCIDYFVQSMSQLKGVKGHNYNDDQSLIFCFDISGSMCVTSPVIGKHKFKGNTIEKNLKDLMAFSDGSDQFYMGKKNVTYISRLQCLQAAIESNLNILLKASPNRKVGFVVFNNEVIGFGDGTKDLVKISGNNLNDLEQIKLIAEKSNGIITTPIKDAQANLLKQLYSIEENGQTALGPAVLFSINLISGVSPGSRIILCTDGISNMGIGSMEGKNSVEDVQELKNFYSNLGLQAKEKGITIDLITFEDEQSNIEILMAMIDQTGGEIIRVKTEEILEQFSNLLTNEVIATNVRAKVKLHKFMHFRNEEIKDIKHEGSTLVKEIGNVTKESELYIEYGFKKIEEMAKYNDIEFDKLTQVPFQSIIDYTNKNGDRCIRVLTKNQKLCSEKDVIQDKANFNIISTNAIQKTSKLAKEGNYREAQSNALAWKKMIKSQATQNNNAMENYKIFNNNMNDFNNDIQEMQYDKICSQQVQDGVGNNFNGVNSPNVSQMNSKSQNVMSDKISEQIHSFKRITNEKSVNNYMKKKK